MLEQRTTTVRGGAFSDCMIVVIMTIMVRDLRRPMDRHSCGDHAALAFFALLISS
jgi:uncharacterized membrane protein